jgi:anhydro-N-acetylmuramic acid kinase
MRRHSVPSSAHNSHYYIGLMSGTSADGIDAALVAMHGEQIELHAYIEQPLAETLRSQLLTLNRAPQLALEDLCQLQYDVAQTFIQATEALLEHAKLDAGSIRAIGSHGQTLFHAPHIPMSLQIGHPALIAKQTGIDTVADFRIDNMAVGGQGAPLAPAFHQALFAPDTPCCVVNIGGIANISLLRPDSAPQGFDCGPGNALMDELSQRHFDCPYDRNGAVAASAEPVAALLHQLLEHPYFQQSFPKSTGRETFHSGWLAQQLEAYAQPVAPAELMATLSELTAAGIAQSVAQLGLHNGPLWVVGGGAFNPDLIARLQRRLPDFQVASSAVMGINPAAIEAMMCAWLAHQRLEARPIPLKAVTGARKDVTLGGVWLAD